MLEVVVVGGGLAGCAAALSLAERGVAVNLIEECRPGSAATGASAGMLAPQYEAPGPGALFEALLRSRTYFPDFARTLEMLAGERIGVRWDGMLVANLDQVEHRHAEEVVTWQRAARQEVHLLDSAEAHRLQPGVTRRAISYLWLPGEGQVDTQRLPDILPAALAAAGVRVIRSRVAALVVRGGSAEGVALDGGQSVPADAVIVAAGAWSGGVGGLPRALPVRPVRGHLLRFPAGAARLDRLVAGHAGRYLVPRDDGSVLAGSTMDESGFDRSIVESSVRTVHGSATSLFPALGLARPTEQWADLRPISADRLPIVGPDPEVKNLIYATGYGRNGILLSPLAGHVVAGIVLGEPLLRGWEEFAVERFADAGRPAGASTGLSATSDAAEVGAPRR